MVINGKKVKELRAGQQKTAVELGASIEMSHTWVYSIEAKDAVKVKNHTAHALARVLGVKIKDIIKEGAV